MLTAELRELRRWDETVILKITFMEHAAFWIEGFDELRRTASNHTVSVRKRFRHHRICANNSVVSKYDSGQDDRSHPNPTIFSDNYLRFDMLPVVIEIMVGTDDPDIRSNLRVVTDHDLTDTLNIAPWHQAR